MDGDTGQILYSKAKDQPYPPASITKLMTTLLTLENLSLDDQITFSRNAVMSIERGSSHIGLREGEIITVEDALHGLLLASANEVANGLAEAVSGSLEAFAEAMNQRALVLGATHTNFVNANGLYDEDQVTSAYDMALITKELLKHDEFLEVMSHSKWQIPETNMVDEIRYLHQGHKLLNPLKDPSLYREDAIAGKTGYTVQSGHTLVTVAQRDGRRLIAVSLRTDASHLYSDTNAMLDYGFSSFKPITINTSDIAIPFTINEGNVEVGSTTIVAALPIKALILNGEDAHDFIHEEQITGTIDAESKPGDIVGSIVYKKGTRILGTTDLILSDIQLVAAMDGEPQKAEASSETEVKSKSSVILKVVFILLLVVLIPVVVFILIRYDRSKRLSYRQYKAMRESER